MIYADLFHGIARFVFENEGIHLGVYRDSKGIPTVGVGFNLHRTDAKQVLKDVGADYDEILNSKCLTLEQALRIFAHDLSWAEHCAEEIVPHWEEFPYSRKMAFVDMIFNLGAVRFKKFKKMLAALEERDYEEAAKEAKDSKWYTDVKSRGPRVVALIRKG